MAHVTVVDVCSPVAPVKSVKAASPADEQSTTMRSRR
jgi:hypothetical protein